jgi:hypothetical protein
MDKEQRDVEKEFLSRWDLDPDFLKEWRGGEAVANTEGSLFCQACMGFYVCFD